MTLCGLCGADAAREDFCPRCGQRISAGPSPTSPPPPTVPSPVVPAPTYLPPPVSGQYLAPAQAPAPAVASPRRSGRTAAAVVAVCVVALVGAMLTYGLTRGGDEPQAPVSGETVGDPAEAISASTSDDAMPTPTPTAEPSVSDEAPPLAIGASYVNQPCSDEYIVMLATEDNPAEYESHLGAAVSGVPGARYLRGADSCDAFVKRGPSTGELVYNAYVGPFPTLGDACTALSKLSSETAWTRQLSYPSPDRSLCICETPSAALPVIGGSDGSTSATSLPVRRAIAQIQWVLYVMGINPDREAIYGNYTAAFDRQVRVFQVRQGLVDRAADGGRVGEQTWTALRNEYCGNPAYDVAR